MTNIFRIQDIIRSIFLEVVIKLKDTLDDSNALLLFKLALTIHL